MTGGGKRRPVIALASATSDKPKDQLWRLCFGRVGEIAAHLAAAQYTTNLHRLPVLPAYPCVPSPRPIGALTADRSQMCRPWKGPAVSASSAVNSRRNTRGPWRRRRPGVRQICSIRSADRSRGTKERPPGMRKRAPECASTCSCKPPCGRWNSALYAAPSASY
jgi:hypothetical protein